MKEEIINLIKKFNSDSKKISEKAGEELSNIFQKRLDELFEIYSYYNINFWNEYVSGSGSLEILEADLDSENVTVKYECSWSYGGYSKLIRTFGLYIFAPDYLEKVREHCIESNILRIKEQKELALRRIEDLNLELIKFTVSEEEYYIKKVEKLLEKDPGLWEEYSQGDKVYMESKNSRYSNKVNFYIIKDNVKIYRCFEL